MHRIFFTLLGAVGGTGLIDWTFFIAFIEACWLANSSFYKEIEYNDIYKEEILAFVAFLGLQNQLVNFFH